METQLDFLKQKSHFTDKRLSAVNPKNDIPIIFHKAQQKNSYKSGKQSSGSKNQLT